MQERVNKFKPLSKKEVGEIININQETVFTQNSKLSSISQNKLFIRKPVSKRNAFVSPTFVKTRTIQNQEVKTPNIQGKGKKNLQGDTHSDQDYWQIKQKSQLSNKIALKRYTSNDQNSGQQQNAFNNNKAIKQAYFGNDMHALTQIGQVYKVQTIESDNSQKDLYFAENMKKTSKQNIVINSLNLNSKKVTRTEYFTHPVNDQVRSSTSRSLKDKQLNFSQLRISLNNNPDAYIRSLQDNIRKLQKINYTINKKSKWLHEEVQMHLQKQHLMAAQKKGLELQLKSKQNDLKSVTKQKQQLKNQLNDYKLQLERKQQSLRNRSFKDIETISSLKQFCSRGQQKSFSRENKNQQFLQGCIGSSPSSIEKNKKHSFKTYPGVTPKKRNNQTSKCSSIVGNSESSFHDLGQSSILYQKSSQKAKSQFQGIEKNDGHVQQLKKERDILKQDLDKIKQEMDQLKESSLKKVIQNSQQYEKIITSKDNQISALKQKIQMLEQQKITISSSMDTILEAHKSQVSRLNNKIKQIETKPAAVQIKDLYELNPLQHFLDHNSKSFPQQTQKQHLEQQNKSLRIYIQKVLEHYKYIKIQNRMLLKMKQDFQKLQKQKKQIKDQRDMFKKKLLDTIKNKGQVMKNGRKMIDFGSESSQSQSSAVFDLSQSQIIHNDSDIQNQ